MLAAFLGIGHLSDAAVTALATLAGVVIGAVVVRYRLERRREKAQGRAGARVVRMDVAIAADRLKQAHAEAMWWPFYAVALESWSRYRDVIAIALGADAWVTVSQSAIELQLLDEGFRESPAANSPRAMTENSTADLATMRGNAIKAFNALAKLADDKEELPLHEPPAWDHGGHRASSRCSSVRVAANVVPLLGGAATNAPAHRHVTAVVLADL
ncbi:MAG: hypothetical protein ACXVSL_08735 [Solirubrobacteraceae bacterium]